MISGWARATLESRLTRTSRDLSPGRRRSRISWWVRYQAHGRWHWESAHSDRRDVADALLRTREREAEESSRPAAQVGSTAAAGVGFAEAAAALIADYEINGKIRCHSATATPFNQPGGSRVAKRALGSRSLSGRRPGLPRRTRRAVGVGLGPRTAPPHCNGLRRRSEWSPSSWHPMWDRDGSDGSC
jgi:hypothetical protein